MIVNFMLVAMVSLWVLHRVNVAVGHWLIIMLVVLVLLVVRSLNCS